MIKQYALLINAGQCLPKARAFLSAGLALVLALVVSFGISEVIQLIQHDADQWRVGQVLLMRMDKKVDQFRILEGQLSADPSLVHGDMSQVDQLNTDTQQLLDQLLHLQNDPKALPQVRLALAHCRQALHDEFQLADVGKDVQARAVHDDRAIQAFDTLK